MVVLGERHLRRIMRHYVSYYHGAQTHLALEKDTPEPRSVQPPDMGKVIEIPEVGGLHHRYERRGGIIRVRPSRFQGRSLVALTIPDSVFQLLRKAAGKLGPAACVRKMTRRPTGSRRACKPDVGPRMRSADVLANHRSSRQRHADHKTYGGSACLSRLRIGH